VGGGALRASGAIADPPGRGGGGLTPAGAAQRARLPPLPARPMTDRCQGSVAGRRVPGRRSAAAHPPGPFVPRRPGDIERWLQASEASAATAAGHPITPGTEKLVVWNGGAPCRTDVALVYVHGYTGSRQATAPVPEQIAGRLAANLFCTRLTGSGLGSDAIGAATLACWRRDVTEALQVGAAIGRRVVLIGMSTGAALAVSEMAQRTEVARHPSVAALVLLAPNFWPRNRGVSLLLTPAGPLLARLLVGPYRDLSGRDEREDRYWTTRHHSRSLIPMMQAVHDARRAALEAIRCPTLVVYTEQDEVVSVAAIKAAHARLGSPRKQLLDLRGADRHELAGAIHAPAMVPALTAAVTRFLSQELR